MDKFIIIIVIVFLIIAGVLFVNNYILHKELTKEPPNFDKEPNFSSRNNIINDDELNNQEENNTKPKTSNIGGGAGGGAGSGSSSGGSESTNTTTIDPGIDPYIRYEANVSPCGMYTRGYGLCAGTCPGGGTCESEGKSCYCKV